MSFPALVASGIPQLVATYLHALPLTSHGVFFSCACFLEGPPVILNLGPTLIQGDLMLTRYTCSDPTSKEGNMLR